MKCSFCDKEIEDIIVNVDLNVSVRRKREDTTWENIPNMNIRATEEICEECFDKFADTISDGMLKGIKNV